MPLKFIKKKVEKTTGLRKLLHRQMADAAEPGRPLTRVHASDVTYSSRPFCPRERAYLIRDKKKPPNGRISTSEVVTYGIGHAVEDMIIASFVEMGMAVGDWKCGHCGKFFKFCKRPPKCDQCGDKRLEYVECRITSPVTGISCGIDLILDFPGDNLHTMVEIKTMDKDQFKQLVAPLAEHTTRTRLYMRSAAESQNLPDQQFTNLLRTDRAFILYSTKGGYGNACEEVPTWEFWDAPFSPFKDFIIERNDKSLDSVVEPALVYKMWKEAHEAWLASGQEGDPPLLPPRICASSLDKRAKQCSCTAPCFFKKDAANA